MKEVSTADDNGTKRWIEKTGRARGNNNNRSHPCMIERFMLLLHYFYADKSMFLVCKTICLVFWWFCRCSRTNSIDLLWWTAAALVNYAIVLQKLSKQIPRNRAHDSHQNMNDKQHLFVLSFVVECWCLLEEEKFRSWKGNLGHEQIFVSFISFSVCTKCFSS